MLSSKGTNFLTWWLILVLVKYIVTMAPLQIPNNFKFKLIHPLPSITQDGANMCSSSWHYAYVSPYERSLVVVFDDAWKAYLNRMLQIRGKYMMGQGSFRMLKQCTFHGLNSWSMKKVESTMLDVKYALMLKEKKSF